MRAWATAHARSDASGRRCRRTTRVSVLEGRPIEWWHNVEKTTPIGASVSGSRARVNAVGDAGVSQRYSANIGAHGGSSIAFSLNSASRSLGT
jgi:hypothetical protein